MAIGVDFSGILGSAGNYAKSGAFWMFIIIIFVIIVVFGYGYMTRRSKLKYNVIEFVRFGNGKVGVNLMKAGLFKTKTFLFGLFDYGSESVMKVTDGRIIQQAKTYQLHDVMGKKGFLVIRSPKDNKVLVPLSKVDFENLQAMLAIAPGDYRDAATRIFREAVDETKGNWEKLLPYLGIAAVVIVCLVTVVICNQMVSHTVDQVGQSLVAKCQNQVNTVPGKSP